jgi:hypothetical protein
MKHLLILGYVITLLSYGGATNAPAQTDPDVATKWVVCRQFLPVRPPQPAAVI